MVVPTPHEMLRYRSAWPWASAEHDSPSTVLTALGQNGRDNSGSKGHHQRATDTEQQQNPATHQSRSQAVFNAALKEGQMDGASLERGKGRIRRFPHPRMPLKNPPANRTAQAASYDLVRPKRITVMVLARLPMTITGCRKNQIRQTSKGKGRGGLSEVFLVSGVPFSYCR